MKLLDKIRLGWELVKPGLPDASQTDHFDLPPGAFGIGETASQVAPLQVEAVQDFQEQIVTRRQMFTLAEHRLNRLVQCHKIRLENYTPGLFDRLSKDGRPGEAIKGPRTSLGELYASLDDGSFVPDPAKGERSLTTDEQLEIDTMTRQLRQPTRRILRPDDPRVTGLIGKGEDTQ
jgi:hypothetical protein